MKGTVQTGSARRAASEFSWDRLWSLFDGDAQRLNIAHECLDRHPPSGTAVRVAGADGSREELSFGELSRRTAQFAHLLTELGVAAGERVAVLMEPSGRFYAALFGVIKRGAVAVPLYTLFGPDAVAERLADCAATLLVVDPALAELAAGQRTPHLVYDDTLAGTLAGQPEHYRPDTAAGDTAVLQYTSGTTRALPEAVRHPHRSVVTLARAALYGLGLRAGDRYFCPSSPAWGHGLWHGTISPWLLGIAAGSYAGRFSPDTLVDALVELRITNLAAASTVYRMILRTGRAGELAGLRVASYTGEELDADAQHAFAERARVPVCGMYGTTETGVVLVNFPGFDDYLPRPGALGKPMPGCEVTVLGEDGAPVPPGTVGELAVRRRGDWFRAKDLAVLDDEGYFHYRGRADDVIISAGWTISPLEVERTLHTHPDVLDAAVTGVPDPLRGQLVKAFVVSTRDDPDFLAELREYVRRRLAQHEYPRLIERVTELPRTANGKLNRAALR